MNISGHPENRENFISIGEKLDFKKPAYSHRYNACVDISTPNLIQYSLRKLSALSKLGNFFLSCLTTNKE